MTAIELTIVGEPIPQGSKTQGTSKGGRRFVRDDNPRTKPWRRTVTAAANLHRLTYPAPTIIGPVRVVVAFRMPRPKHHYRTGRYADQLRDNAPHWCTTKPDVDKLQRAMFDAITDSEIWRDDSLVVAVTASMTYADRPDRVGATILITELPTQPTERTLTDA